MARVHTHYDNLKVARDAPPEVIRAAYKTLSQKHHPDRNGNSKEAIRIIQLINSAYEVLSDPVRRREHDEWIVRSERDGGTPQQPTPVRDPAHPRRPSPAGQWRAYEARRSRRRPSSLSKLMLQASSAWDRLARKLARKVFGKV